jgi:hypothetical protein
LACARAEQWRELGSGLLVFFHGQGVDHAAQSEASARWRRLGGWHGVVLAVCTGSWSRRYQSPPAEPFLLSSLTGFWNHAIEADRVECYGVGNVE